MADLAGKKILFFAPRFFNYEREIMSFLERNGATVHYYDERANPSKLQKILIRKARFLVSGHIDAYYKNIIANLFPDYYDYVLVISPETMRKTNVEMLRSNQKRARFILYMWDSIENKNASSVLAYFDTKMSFDKNDCDSYGMRFRPLFFLNEFENGYPEYVSDKCCFIGTMHSDRFRILKSLKTQFEVKGFEIFFFLYFASKIQYYVKRIIDSSYWAVSKGIFSFKPMDRKDIADVIRASKIVIDIQHPKQLGLTIRTIEVLGMQKKLVTTNKDILNYDFYCPENICFIDRFSPVVSDTFLNSEYKKTASESYDRYKIESWVSEIFN